MKRVIALITALCMLFGVCTAFAAEVELENNGMYF